MATFDNQKFLNFLLANCEEDNKGEDSLLCDEDYGPSKIALIGNELVVELPVAEVESKDTAKIVVNAGDYLIITVQHNRGDRCILDASYVAKIDDNIVMVLKASIECNKYDYMRSYVDDCLNELPEDRQTIENEEQLADMVRKFIVMTYCEGMLEH